jgi:GNAT superfamily N-acetyltransferase
VLARGASEGDCTRAAAANQTSWAVLTAEAAGGSVHREQGVTSVASTAGATLAFPELSSERLSGLVPQFLSTARRAGAREASCWSLLPTEPRNLGEALLEAGFREGWQARWMAGEVAVYPPTPAPDGVQIGLAPPSWKATKLPWDSEGIAGIRSLLADAHPRRAWHLGAWRNGTPVGHALLHVSSGRLGVGGIYDMGVAEHERRRGIGTALTLAAVELARTQGCAIVTLNATPEGALLYRTLGFRDVGVAQTWWLEL